MTTTSAASNAYLQLATSSTWPASSLFVVVLAALAVLAPSVDSASLMCNRHSYCNGHGDANETATASLRAFSAMSVAKYSGTAMRSPGRLSRFFAAQNASAGNCTCTCDAQWTGDRCDVCPLRYSVAHGCAECAFGFAPYPLCAPLPPATTTTTAAPGATTTTAAPGVTTVAPVTTATIGPMTTMPSGANGTNHTPTTPMTTEGPTTSAATTTTTVAVTTTMAPTTTTTTVAPTTASTSPTSAVTTTTTTAASNSTTSTIAPETTTLAPTTTTTTQAPDTSTTAAVGTTTTTTAAAVTTASPNATTTTTMVPPSTALTTTTWLPTPPPSTTTTGGSNVSSTAPATTTTAGFFSTTTAVAPTTATANFSTTAALATTTTTTTAAPTTWAPCVLSNECVEAHTAQVVLNGTDGSCRCDCDGQWNGPRCGECPWRLQPTTCAACITGRIGFPQCPATAIVRALVDTKPSLRVGVPLSAAGVTFWRAAAATSILQSITTSVCDTGGASVVVAVTDARSASADGGGDDAAGVLKLTVVVSLVQDTPGATAGTGPADVAAVASAARCISSLFGLPSRFLPLNVNATDAPRYDPQTPADSSFFVFVADGNATEAASSPCGDVVCSSTAASNAADMPPDPAAAAAQNGGGGGDEQDTGTRDLIIVLVVGAVAGLVVIAIVVGRRQRQAAVMRRRAERHATGVSFADAIAAEMPLLDMPVSEAANIMNARNEPVWKHDVPVVPMQADNGHGDTTTFDDGDDDVSLGGESIPDVEGSFISPSLSQRRRNNAAENHRADSQVD